MVPFNEREIADHLRSAQRLAEQAERLAEHFDKQTQIHRERAARFHGEAAAWEEMGKRKSSEASNVG